MTTLPLWIWVAGVIVLGITLAYGILRNRTRTARERAITEEATKENYRQEDRSSK
jgi:cytochrome c-type biogenesis protein CcmH/NrfF